MNDKCFATGKVIELNKEKFELKIRLINSCDRKGIIVLEFSGLIKVLNLQGYLIAFIFR